MDKINKKLLGILQDNGRESLTKIARTLNLSIDSTHKRMKKLKQEGIISKYSIYIDPKRIGYELVANVQIKLNNISENELTETIAFLKTHPNVIELIQTLGEFDMTCVLIAKNTFDLEEISREIRNHLKSVILNWKTVINLKVHKFEYYDLNHL